MLPRCRSTCGWNQWVLQLQQPACCLRDCCSAECSFINQIVAYRLFQWYAVHQEWAPPVIWYHVEQRDLFWKWICLSMWWHVTVFIILYAYGEGDRVVYTANDSIIMIYTARTLSRDYKCIIGYSTSYGSLMVHNVDHSLHSIKLS